MAAAKQFRGVVSAATADAWLEAIDAQPAWRHRTAWAKGDFNAHSSSLRLAAVGGLDLPTIAASLLASEVGSICHAQLGDELVCAIDHCWVRRQYAPGHYPPGHAAHAWHQDGALGFDFLGAGAQIPRSALLSMLTCWIALTRCGVEAPGLELVDCELDALLPLAALTDESVRARHAKAGFLRPAMAAGDALVFGGGVLHHTHVHAAMHLDRTSVELRFFAAGDIPERLRHGRFLHLTPIPEICR
jgi:hypothetical protein